MSALAFESVSDEWLRELSFRVEPGVTTIYGEPAAVGRILELAAGARRARRGRVVLGEQSVVEPRVRSRIAALLPEERLLALPTVRDAVRATLELRGAPSTLEHVLENPLLTELGARKPHRLSALERRAIALLLALEDTQADALLLYDPFSTSPLVPRARIIDVCLARARAIPVLIATPYVEDALVFGGKLFTFARGALYATPSARTESRVALSVHSERAQALAELLASEPGVLGVVFDSLRAPFEVRVEAEDPELLAEIVTRVACEHAIPVTSLVTHGARERAPALRGMPGIWVAPSNQQNSAPSSMPSANPPGADGPSPRG